MLRPRFPVVLASQSPRRKELLGRIFESFEVLPSGMDEAFPAEWGATKAALRLARAKAMGVRMAKLDHLIIAADTVVVMAGEVFGKPADEAGARSMLASLSGQEHQVATAVAIQWPGTPYGQSDFVEQTTVRFRDLSREEIDQYVSTAEPMDKAGAYAIQGGAAEFVAHLEGDYDNVVGLPVARLTQELIDQDLVEENEI